MKFRMKKNRWYMLPELSLDHPILDDYCFKTAFKEETQRMDAINAMKVMSSDAGAAVSFLIDDSLTYGTAKAALLWFGINADRLLYDDVFDGHRRRVFLFVLSGLFSDAKHCPHCYHDCTFDLERKLFHCTKCDWARGE